MSSVSTGAGKDPFLGFGFVVMGGSNEELPPIAMLYGSYLSLGLRLYLADSKSLDSSVDAHCVLIIA